MSPLLRVTDALDQFGIPPDPDVRDRLCSMPIVCAALIDLRRGALPEQAAARFDLPWVDDGPGSHLDWEAILS